MILSIGWYDDTLNIQIVNAGGKAIKTFVIEFKYYSIGGTELIFRLEDLFVFTGPYYTGKSYDLYCNAGPLSRVECISPQYLFVQFTDGSYQTVNCSYYWASASYFGGPK